MINDNKFSTAGAIEHTLELLPKQISTDKSTVISNVKGKSVIHNAKEVVVSVKNKPTSSYAETEVMPSAHNKIP